MRGHIKKRTEDSWTVVLYLGRDPSTGKRRYKWITVKGTRKEAERVLAEALIRVERREYGTAPLRLTTGQYIMQWLEAIAGYLKPGTVRSYSVHLKRLVPFLGQIPLAKLTALDVQQALAALPQDLAPATRRATFDTLGTALRQAVRWGLIHHDPTAGVIRPQKNFREIKVWTEEEILRFLETARKSNYHIVFYLALATGMRLGEILALTWDNIDFDLGVIHVNRSMTYCASGHLFQEPKTRAARRRIPVDEKTLTVLRQHKKDQAAQRLKAGPRWENYNLVCCTRLGRPLRHADVYHRLRPLALEAGVPVLRFHDLRHTHATVLLRQNVHPKVVAERLGHTRVAFTLDTYSHVLPDTQAQAVRAIYAVLNGVRRG